MARLPTPTFFPCIRWPRRRKANLRANRLHMTVRLKQLPASYAYPFTLENEEARLAELYRMGILDTLSDERLNRYTRLLADTLEVPSAFVALREGGKAWFKLSVTPDNASLNNVLPFFFAELGQRDLVIVDDATLDPRVATHPAVLGDRGIRFYAGAALQGPTGCALGVCCIMDYRSRTLSPAQCGFLRQTVGLIEQELQDREIVVELRETIKNEALRDPVTGLPNLTLFRGMVDRVLKEPGDIDRQWLVAAIRLKRYDVLDSAMGRLGAAYLLGDVVKRIERALCDDCSVGQIREDELAIAVPFVGGPSGEGDTLYKLANCFTRPFALGTESFRVFASIGASCYPRDGATAADLLRRARIALRSDRPSGEPMYRRYSQELSTQTDEVFRLEVALARSIERHDFRLAFQPKICLATQRITGAEALLRWSSSEVGAMSPSVFIPLAERIGLADELENLAITMVIDQLEKWRIQGLGDLEISANISGSQLRQPKFSERLISLLAAAGVHGSRLNLEITENSLIEDIEGAIQAMNRLRAHSISFSIDDFGTGFSSLSYLRKMPLSILKIDRSFIQHIPESLNDMTIAKSVIALGHGLGLRVLAEGTENQAQVKFLKEHGCDEVQGFLFFRPLPPQELEILLQRQPPIPPAEVLAHPRSSGIGRGAPTG